MFTGYARRILIIGLLAGGTAVGLAAGLSRATSDPAALRTRLAAWIGPQKPLPLDPVATGSLSLATVVLDPCTGQRKN